MEESKFEKFKKWCPDIVYALQLVLSLICLIIMYLIFKGTKLDNMVNISNVTVGLQVFIAFYCIPYLSLWIWTLVRFWKTKRLCQVHNVIFMAVSLIFIGLSAQLTREITQASWNMQQEMTTACDVDAKSGLLYEMNKEYNYSQNLLCSPKCPCNLAMTNSTNLTTQVPNGAFNIFKCPGVNIKSDSDFS